jgi:hypothetical protein
MSFRVLDITPGNRGIWFDKNHPAAMFSSDLDAIESSGFDLVVFDPPHVNTGAKGNMAKNYGHHTALEIRAFVIAGARTAHRVAAPRALMAFKWNDHDLKLASVLELMQPWWEPLFGQKTATRTPRLNSTYWVMLLRRGE